MPLHLTIYYHSDIYEVTYTPTAVIHIDKVLGDSQVRRETTFERLPDAVKNEILSNLTSEEED